MKFPRKLNDDPTIDFTDCKLQILCKILLTTASNNNNNNNEAERERNEMKLLDGVADLNQHWYSLNMFAVFILLHFKSTGKTEQKIFFVFYQFMQAFLSFATLISSCQKFVDRLLFRSPILFFFILMLFIFGYACDGIYLIY